MTATNHAITGAIIATVIHKPAIALPIALLSHFATDAIPHFGYGGHGGYRQAIKRKLQKAMMLADPIAFVPFLLILITRHASIWVYLAAFLAVSPDLHDFIAYFFFKKDTGWNRFSKLASAIQWCERPWGVTVEIAWYFGGLFLLNHLLG